MQEILRFGKLTDKSFSINKWQNTSRHNLTLKTRCSAKTVVNNNLNNKHANTLNI